MGKGIQWSIKDLKVLDKFIKKYDHPPKIKR